MGSPLDKKVFFLNLDTSLLYIITSAIIFGCQIARADLEKYRYEQEI